MTTTTKSPPEPYGPCFTRVTGTPIALRNRARSEVMVSPGFHPRDILDLVGDHCAPSERCVEGGRLLSMRTTRPLLTATFLLALAAGCTASPGVSSSTPTSSATVPSPAVSASPSPSPTDPKALARTHAEELTREYYALADQLGGDPKAPLSRLKRVATSVELDIRQQELEQWRNENWHQTGSTQIADLVVQSVSLDNSDPTAGLVPTVQVDVCYDVGDVDLVDASGTSVISSSRPDRRWERLQVANYDYEADPTGGWRVASLETLEKAPCAG
ncbi:hypothetical protein ACFT2C_04570 [Promicromonospora sp. NPDC057138]|uniref:hypothetical protein n=1 Tax=Promicromonospora sp. NPDC057138 TaxID=3346031 RepID=UPI00363D7374